MNASVGKLVAITGVTRGLGRAMTEEFARLGHTVAGCGRSKKDVAELREKLSQPHQLEIVDVTRDDEVAAWAKSIVAALGIESKPSRPAHPAPQLDRNDEDDYAQDDDGAADADRELLVEDAANLPA